MRILIPLVLSLALASPLSAERVTVGPGQDALATALARARPGDELVLPPGTYAGPVEIDRPVTLTGDDARIVGPGAGSVITVTAPDVTLRGLAVSGAGASLADLDSGIRLLKGADRARLEGLTLEGNLIGIDVHGARDVVVRGNTILGRNDLRVAERGPGVYVWNAPGLTVEDNIVSRGRDGVFITTSDQAVYRRNTFSELRFAFHSMYANRIEVTDNVSRGNDMGFAFMYSTRLTIANNLSVGDANHGFFMNFANRAELIGNTVRDGGEKCLFIYNSNNNRFTGNRFEGCGIGLHFTAGSEGNVMTGNAFVGNRTQVKYVGTRWLEWSEAGQGNYWSDHVAFDVNGDGIADSPYRPNDAVDQLVWSQPAAKLLMRTPALQLMRWSQSRFPGLLPGGVIDSHPLTAPQISVPEVVQ
ncbi:nitrous oxide reductase family maturation protein NosD [Maritimibacter sp. DP1N21-5]|uniref:nitrous oxide reductase family maturation protein NosD n=1 Tax=Maritimibacter sp. DP1N21-5 TaxID=2836867 RepID=UPI001C457869|nr:nitrous oxide reductase family maturation protein NosD [Maritimibacter sp. DP1N21-5]MBV7410077.1 nitrous oxide reductase family maturation protein NosD [Maritimibacter sp. DP1N21-5]